MRIKFYKNSGEKIVVDKTKFLSNELIIDCVLKGGCNIIQPSLILDYTKQDVISYNYCYIEEFNRWYFVDNIEYGVNNIIIIYLSIDVLYSYKDSLLLLDGYIIRNEFSYNNLIEDKLIDYRYDKEIIDENNFIYNLTFKPNLFSNEDIKNVIINTITDEVKTYGIKEQESFGILPAINYASTGDFLGGEIYCCSTLVLSKLQSESLADDTIPSFIKSILILPFEIPFDYFRQSNGEKITDASQINKTYQLAIGKRFIDLTYELWYGNNLGSYWRIKFCSYKFKKADSYLFFSPYSYWQIYIPYVGYVDLNYEEIDDSNVIIFYNVNINDGSAICIIYNETRKRVIKQENCQLGVLFSLSSTNNREATNQRINQAVSTSIGTLTSVLSIGTGIATGNAVGVVIGASQLGDTVSKSVSGFNSIYDTGNAKISSGNSGLQMPQKCYIKRVLAISTNGIDNKNFNKLFGKPLNENKTLNNLRGFTKIENVHIEGDGFKSATNREIEELEKLTKNGIIL